MAYKKNLYIDQGSDYELVTTYKEDDSDEVFNLEGFTSQSQIRKNYHSRNFIEFESEIDLDAGEIYFRLPASVSSEMEAGRYVYDIEITGPDGFITRILEGLLEIRPAVTR